MDNYYKNFIEDRLRVLSEEDLRTIYFFVRNFRESDKRDTVTAFTQQLDEKRQRVIELIEGVHSLKALNYWYDLISEVIRLRA